MSSLGTLFCPVLPYIVGSGVHKDALDAGLGGYLLWLYGLLAAVE